MYVVYNVLRKSKIIPVLKNGVMKTYQEHGCKTLAILIPELHVGEWSTPHFGHIFLLKETLIQH
jgi:hypothetical protein